MPSGRALVLLLVSALLCLGVSRVLEHDVFTIIAQCLWRCERAIPIYRTIDSIFSPKWLKCRELTRSFRHDLNSRTARAQLLWDTVPHAQGPSQNVKQYVSDKRQSILTCYIYACTSPPRPLIISIKLLYRITSTSPTRSPNSSNSTQPSIL